MVPSEPGFIFPQVASFNLTATRKFPEGTSVGAYPASQWRDQEATPSGAPPGAATASATVTNGVAAFTGLTTGVRYWAGASVSGTWQYAEFTAGADTQPSSTTSLLDLPAGFTGNNRYERGISAYNFKPSNMKKARAVVGKGMAGTAPARIMCVGDSNTGAPSAADPALYSWPIYLRNHLEKAGAVIAGTGNVLPANTNTQDSRVVFTGGAWVNLASGGKTPIAQSAAASGKVLTFTSDKPGTIVRVRYPKNAALYGAFTVVIDGGAPVTVTPSGTAAMALYEVTGLANTTHTVVITTTTTTITGIGGVEVTNDNGFSIDNFGLSGSKTGPDWTSASWFNATPIAKAMGDALTIIMLQTNDAVNAIDLPTYLANYAYIIQQFQANGDVILATCPPPSAVTQAAYDAYTQAHFTLADTYDVPLLHLAERHGTYAEGTANGLMADTLHVSPAGGARIARTIAQALLR